VVRAVSGAAVLVVASGVAGPPVSDVGVVAGVATPVVSEVVAPVVSVVSGVAATLNRPVPASALVSAATPALTASALAAPALAAPAPTAQGPAEPGAHALGRDAFGVLAPSTPAAAMAATTLFGGESNVSAPLSRRFGSGRAVAPGSGSPAPNSKGLPSSVPAAPAGAGGAAGALSGAGVPAAVLGELLAGLLLGAALCCSGRTRRSTWWFPEVVVGPG